LLREVEEKTGVRITDYNINFFGYRQAQDWVVDSVNR
jgi:Fur family ferric uptake transcriptional regulator